MTVQRTSGGLLRAGAGRAPVTPPAGFPIFSPESAPHASTGVDDDLLARVVLFEAEGRRAVVCSLDAWGIEPDLHAAIRHAAAKAAGTQDTFSWLTVSGNGTSPATWEGTTKEKRYERYLAYLPDLVSGAAAQAKDTLQPAALGGVSAQLPDVTTGVAGRGVEADSAVNIAAVSTESGDGLGLVVSYSCPAIVRGPHGRWTADYPGYTSWALEQAGWGLVAFARGSDADVRPYDWFAGNPSPSHQQRGPADVQALGLLLATQASTALRQVEYRRNVSIEAVRDDSGEIHVLRVGGIVFVSVLRPQPAVFARHLRRAIPRSTVIVSTNVAGHLLSSSVELDVDLELTALETARAAGAK